VTGHAYLDSDVPVRVRRRRPTYSGRHSGGGAVCLTLTKDFSGVVWFHALDVPADHCKIGWHVDKMDLPRRSSTAATAGTAGCRP
jgi:hypothetical protein